MSRPRDLAPEAFPAQLGQAPQPPQALSLEDRESIEVAARLSIVDQNCWHAIENVRNTLSNARVTDRLAAAEVQERLELIKKTAAETLATIRTVDPLSTLAWSRLSLASRELTRPDLSPDYETITAGLKNLIHLATVAAEMNRSDPFITNEAGSDPRITARAAAIVALSKIFERAGGRVTVSNSNVSHKEAPQISAFVAFVLAIWATLPELGHLSATEQAAAKLIGRALNR